MVRAKVDVVGLGQNATDTVMTVRAFPALGGKERVVASCMQSGGQMATAIVTCRRLGLKVRYIGKVGDDHAGQVQLASLRREGLELIDTKVVRGAPTQYGLIIIDAASGERTIFWDRDSRLAVQPREIKSTAITSARLLHVDGSDVDAMLVAVRLAHKAHIPVLADFDTKHKNIEKLFPYIDYLIAPTGFMHAVTGQTDPVKTLKYMAHEYHVRTPGMTLGRDGALVYHDGGYVYSPGFVVKTVDTTGAGDVFHGAFAYALLANWDIARTLDFSNAMAALNCTALGARGGIKSRAEAEHLIATGKRHVNAAYRCAPIG